MNLRRTIALCLCLTTLGVVSCSSEEDSCQARDGIICNNCSSAGDCTIQCAAGDVEHCVGLEYFNGENPDDKRCAFCE